MTSIRWFLTSRVLAATCVILLIGHVALYLFASKRLQAHYDRALVEKVRAFAGLIEREPEGVLIEMRQEFFQQYARRHNADYFEVWDETGAVLARSSSLQGGDLPRQTGALDKPVLWDLTLPDGRLGRAVGIHFSPPADEDHPGPAASPVHVALVLAQDRREIDDVLGILLVGSILTMLFLIVGVVLVVWWVTRLGLAPLNQLADHTARIDIGTLGFRYEQRNLPAELKPIVGRLNELLARLETAFTRERRLTADMAHELKTPLSELKSLAEVARMWPDDRPFVQKALSDTIEIANQMNAMVSLLLTLNRCETGREALSVSTIDLPGLLREQWQPWQKTADQKRITVAFNAPEPIEVLTDRTMLASIIMNLFSNAVEYCPDGGRVACAIRRVDDGVLVSVENSDESLSQEDLTVMFEKLWRKDYARGGGTHCGLGLTLVGAFAQLLGIRIETSLRDGLFRISLRIPQTIMSKAQPVAEHGPRRTALLRDA